MLYMLCVCQMKAACNRVLVVLVEHRFIAVIFDGISVGILCALMIPGCYRTP